jgi:hypothetical protein
LEKVLVVSQINCTRPCTIFAKKLKGKAAGRHREKILPPSRLSS